MKIEDVAEISLRMREVIEQAAREAALVGDGSLMQMHPSKCPHCGWQVTAVWFNSSKAWACTACEGEVPGAPPTREQRRANHPDHALRARLISSMEKSLL